MRALPCLARRSVSTNDRLQNYLSHTHTHRPFVDAPARRAVAHEEEKMQIDLRKPQMPSSH